jgi:hypothetical protein
VRLRLEDIFIGFTFVVYLIYLIRGKINWRIPTWQLIFAYFAVGAMSILCGVFIIHTIPFALPNELIHLSKSVLHYARYIEYFFLAFLFFSSITRRAQLYVIGAAVLFVTSAISIYGVGQKYFYWPVYSTMNREFSKGIPLYLTPHARVQSTFGGHYDFAAYLVLLLPFTLLIAWYAPRRWQRVFAWISHTLGLWALIVSAARTSIVAYFVAVIILFTIRTIMSPRSPARKIGAWFGYQFLYFSLIGLLTFGWGQDMIERFTHALDRIPFFHDTYHTANKWRKEIPYWLGWREHQPPTDGIGVTLDEYGNNVASVLTPSDSQPSTTGKPADVYVDVPDIKIGIDASGTAYTFEATRTWSVNAEKYGLSIGIRLDELWPNAIRGFARQPLLGSGYGTLTKGENLDRFTEADSTDNNYLRTLGETGILGAFTFYGAIVVSLWVCCRQIFTQQLSRVAQFVDYGFLTATIGILINATYIDVFAASKVAFTFWSLFGLFWATQSLNFATKKPDIPPKKSIRKSARRRRTPKSPKTNG